MLKNSWRKIILIVIIFSAINLSWLLIITIKYDKYVKATPKNEWGQYVTFKDGYTYNTKKPGYLHYTGNLAVTNYDSSAILIIWPLISGGYKYGFRIQEDGVAYEIYVDGNMKPIYQDDKEAIQVVEKSKADLEELFAKANKMWHLK